MTTNVSTSERTKLFWPEDGTIILLAGQVKFRVYRGVLTEHSPLFAEMLSLPQPAELHDAQYSSQ
ncbi:hypothetical protein L227DRAFT_576943 [Lentinus tigrinus ALCF2SS1-6]|uniref:BTB domain-containing protein n=1 Tax=Lentinus tigrinus ALCF2SS1-6 TaxID=1328759 RepID=A0A5C2S5S3_9APHY|nr:hypothetical protein L227DRAFT_576943 [Lentinus tigrinus ALCF2SS1-6]